MTYSASLGPLAERELHVWVARSDVAAETLRELSDLLDPEEQERVARFRFEEDRQRAVVARATLRRLLGSYLEREPRALRFVYGPQGKPALADGALEFNVSHSGPLVLLAFARGSAVGVDVEREKPQRELAAIAGRFFAPDEAEKVRDPARDAQAFYRTWTAKESVIKAVGGGLSIDLSSFVVTPARGCFTAVENRGGDGRLDGWFVQTLPEPADEAHAAVAVRGEGWQVLVRQTR